LLKIESPEPSVSNEFDINHTQEKDSFTTQRIYDDPRRTIARIVTMANRNITFSPVAGKL
jgi:hypothetical protein